jgi:hypothetical protein
LLGEWWRARALGDCAGERFRLRWRRSLDLAPPKQPRKQPMVARSSAAAGDRAVSGDGEEVWELVVNAARHLGEKRSRGRWGKRAKPRVVVVAVTVVLTQLACDRWMAERMDGEEEPCQWGPCPTGIRWRFFFSF